MKEFIFCPVCTTKLIEESGHQTCPKCKFTYYDDPSPCASAIPVKDGKFLLAIRGREPYKGGYDLIGGFIEPGETAEEAAIRETKEETGLDVKITKLLGTYSDRYGENGKYTLNLQYIVEIVGGEMKANDDVADLKWIEIKEIPNLKIDGFKNCKEALKDLYRLYY